MKLLHLASLALLSLVIACGKDDDEPTPSGDAGSPGTAGAGGEVAAPGGAGGGGNAGGEAGSIDVAVNEYPATDPNIVFTGRSELREGSTSNPTHVRTSAPAATMRARFRGTAVTVLLEDQHRYDKSNFYDVVIDGKAVYKLEPEQGVTEYEVPGDLEYGDHEVAVVKRSEASLGYAKFLGFRFAGEIIKPPTPRTRRMEFIGDSITAGAGIDAKNESEQCGDKYWGEFNNARLTYGAVAAEAFDAEYHVTAVSGIGLVHNYDTRYDARTMPEVYDLLYLEQTDSPSYDREEFVPDVVVVALGTNDFSAGSPDDPYNQAPEAVPAGGAGGTSSGGGASGADAGGTGGASAGGVSGAAVDVTVAGGADAEPVMTPHRVIPTPEEYATRYIAFVERLRGYYPDAHVFCMSSPMLGNGWPAPSDTYKDDLIDAVQLVEQHFVEAGDDQVHSVVVRRAIGRGCGTHPDAGEHEAIADTLETAISDVLDW